MNSALRNEPPTATEVPAEAMRALAFLLPLSSDYPGIDRWFLSKVVPGLLNETRYLLPVERNGQLVALGIAKNEPDERKICTVRVAPEYVGRGMGVRIFDGLLKWLNTDKPNLTVSESKLANFERIFDWYGFNQTSSWEGLYVPRKWEFGYNDAATGDCSSAAQGSTAR